MLVDLIRPLNNPDASTDLDALFNADLHALRITYPLRQSFTVGDLQTAYLQALVAQRGDPELSPSYAGGGIL